MLWGTGWMQMGWTLLGYEWIYVPSLKWLQVEPWSLTGLGLFAVVIGLSLNLAHLSIHGWPEEKPR